LASGIAGNICIGTDRPCSAGCIPIGPVLSTGGDGLLGIWLNAQWSFSFAGHGRGGICPEIGIGQNVAAPNCRSGLMNVRSPDYIDRPRLYG
jgi:hypothetical protein